MNIKLHVILTVLSSVLSINSFAQVNLPMGDEQENKWGFHITPYALLAAQSTDVDGEEIRQSFNDLSSITNAGFQLSTGLRYKKFILSLDGTFADLKGSVSSKLLDIDVNITQYILDAKLGYLIHSSVNLDARDEVIRGWSLEANLGLKYWKNDVSIKLDGLIDGSIPELQEWSDLMVGVKSRIILNKRVYLGITGSIGGFNLYESASKLSYDITYTNTFNVSNHIWITAGFRSFRYNRTDGEGDQAVTTKVSVLGPMLGLSFVL